MPIIVASALVAAIISCALLSMDLLTVRTANAQMDSNNNPTITSSSHLDSRCSSVHNHKRQSGKSNIFTK
jgi:hypothetical protein